MSMDDATRTALRRYVLSLADSKRVMGIRYSDWLLGAPSIETGIAASSMCQDEWGHARLLYAMLKELGDDPDAAEHERPDDAYASVDPLDVPFPDWAAVVAGMVLVDGALTVALEGFARGSFESATTRVPKMIAEEEFHTSLAVAWYRRLATSATDEARGLLESATRSMLPPMLAWLGADDEGARALVAAGVTVPAAELVGAYRERVGPLVAELGLDVASVAPATAWDAARGRGPGHPDADACARARGDLNRMLFVE
jgi:phenylacetate-CoA oxygenase PaaI subunit